MPFISIIIPTYNRLNQLLRALDGLYKQTYPIDRYEIIIVSDGSKDGTDEYFENLKTPLNIKYITQKNQGPGAARNTGIQHARGELILFIDDDIVPTPTLLEEHARCHDDNDRRTVVIGPMLTPTDFKMSPWVRWEQDHLIEQYKAMESNKWEATARQFYTGNTSLRREHLIEAGGFDPAFRRAEDIELAYRLSEMGLHFHYNARAIGYHYAERSYESWMSIAYSYGRNDVIFSCQKSQTWLLPTIFSEFYTRHILTRFLTYITLDHKSSANLLGALLRAQMQLGDYLQVNTLSDLSCSAIFNMLYYQGMADELGGRDHFFAGLKSTTNPQQLAQE